MSREKPKCGHEGCGKDATVRHPEWGWMCTEHHLAYLNFRKEKRRPMVKCKGCGEVIVDRFLVMTSGKGDDEQWTKVTLEGLLENENFEKTMKEWDVWHEKCEKERR